MIEIWKDIPNYDGKYQISNYGRVKSLNYKRSGKEQTLKPFITGHGYLQVSLCKNGARKLIYIHKVMANVFLDRKSFKSMAYEDRKKIDLNKLEVNHIDENKKNNYIGNLEFCTSKYNVNYGDRNNNVRKKLSKVINQYDLKHNLIKRWNSMTKASKDLNIPLHYISCCCNGERMTTKGYIFEFGDKEVSE